MLDRGTIHVESSLKNQVPGVRYKLYIDAHSGGSKVDVLRYHVTTRNFFAFLTRKPLVGFTFYQAIVDLHERLKEYLSPDIDSAVALQSYLVLIGLVNVSNEPRAAAGLLAWSEDVRWNNGWREAYVFLEFPTPTLSVYIVKVVLPALCSNWKSGESYFETVHSLDRVLCSRRHADFFISFVHSVGMYEELTQLQESADISLPTTAHLDRAHLELQARIHEVEDHLSTFYFDDAHFSHEDMSPTLRAASVRFRNFLKKFYEKEYQTWPIRRSQPGLWLDRTIVGRLQEDFNALYEYSVDRNVTWNGDDESEDRKNKALLKSMNALNFGLDEEDLRMLAVLRNADCRLNASHIPHPYPLLPASMPVPPPAKKSVFGGKKRDKVRESRIALAYSEASNASGLRRQHAKNRLVDAFVHFERADEPGDFDPREARRERWIIIYCVLQTLAGVSVDVPNLSFNGDVSYFLNTRLQGLPPWSPTDKIFMDASREQSYCWGTADSHFEPYASQHGSSSYADSEASSQSRPLSPESPPDTYTFFDSKRATLSSEPETQDLYRIEDLIPVAETGLTSDRSLPPEYPYMSSKFASVAGIDQYTTKTLPIRPNQGSKRDPEVRRPKR